MNALIIGCGGAGSNHANQFKDLGINFEVYDTDVKKAENLSKQHNVNVGDPNKKYDIIVVAVPAVHHSKIIKEHINKPETFVCVEKPMTLKPVDAAYLVNYNNLYVLESMVYSHPVLTAQAALESLGGPVLWRANYNSAYRPQAWINDVEIGGQTMMEGGVHIVSTARYLFGKPVKHTGFFLDENRRNGVITIQFEKGDVLNLTICWGVENCFQGKQPAVPNSNYLIGHTGYMDFNPFDDHKAMWMRILDDIEEPKKVQEEQEAYFTNQMAADAVSSVWKCYQFLDIYTIV